MTVSPCVRARPCDAIDCGDAHASQLVYAGDVLPPQGLRKVVSYRKLSTTDYVDSFGGHGTHVACSVAGNHRTQAPGLANGAAPDARLHFTDIEYSCVGNTSLPTGCGQSLSLPNTYDDVALFISVRGDDSAFCVLLATVLLCTNGDVTTPILLKVIGMALEHLPLQV